VELTVAQAAAAIREGRLDPRELVEAYLARIVERDGLYQAYNTVVAEGARERARELGRSGASGPLHGVPLALKDNFYTAGVATTANSRIFADFVPETDATAWTRLREAGAVLLGKTQMGPLATTAASTPEGERTTVNAWAPDDPEVSPGGSSSGSATAVAAGMAAGATGTQTGGSITSPALAQGLTGLKPTLGRVSLRGVIPLTYTRDHPGPLARDAMDAALLLQLMAGPDPGDPRTLGLPPVPDLVRAATPVTVRGRTTLRWPTTVGVFPGYLDDESEEDETEDPPTRQAPDTASAGAREEDRGSRRREARLQARRRFVATLEELGARVVEVEPPAEWETLTSRPFNNVRLPERSEPFLRHLRDDVRLFGVSLSPWINGLLLSGPAYLRGQRARLLLLRRILDHVFHRCDLVLQSSPIPFDMVGLPLLALPVGMIGEEGIEEVPAPGGGPMPRGVRPTGVILGGQPYAEDRLLSVAAAYQAVTGWHRLRPPAPLAVGARGSVDRPRIGVQEVMDTGE
jgi:Asp-tRNA(Asn)/Glu-tRNA(Gln) amidotransferase A subunit family amidase